MKFILKKNEYLKILNRIRLYKRMSNTTTNNNNNI